MNKIYLTGRITKDIELKEYGDLKVVNNTIAVYDGKDKSVGNPKRQKSFNLFNITIKNEEDFNKVKEWLNGKD